MQAEPPTMSAATVDPAAPTLDAGKVRVPSRTTARLVQRREPCGEVPQLPGLGHDAHAGQLGGPAGDPGDGFDHVVEVALGVGAAGNGEPDQVHRGRGLGAVWPQAEHDGPDLAGPHPASSYSA